MDCGNCFCANESSSTKYFKDYICSSQGGEGKGVREGKKGIMYCKESIRDYDKPFVPPTLTARQYLLTLFSAG